MAGGNSRATEQVTAEPRLRLEDFSESEHIFPSIAKEEKNGPEAYVVEQNEKMLGEEMVEMVSPANLCGEDQS